MNVEVYYHEPWVEIVISMQQGDGYVPQTILRLMQPEAEALRDLITQVIGR